LLTLLTSGFVGVFFKVYPSWRITIEGILIKVGGICFGPIIGVFIAGITDLLTVTLTSGMFHVGYFMSALYLGLGAGMIRTIFNIFTNTSRIKTILIETTLLTLVMNTIISLYLINIHNIYTDITGQLSFTIFGKELHISPILAIAITNSTTCTFLLILWVCYFISYRSAIKLFFIKAKYRPLFRYQNHICQKFKRNQNQQKNVYSLLFWYKRNENKIIVYEDKVRKQMANIPDYHDNYLYRLIPVVCVLCVVEQFVDILVMPPFDMQFGGVNELGFWLSIRIIMYPVTFLFNLAIIYPVYVLTGRFINFRYQNYVKQRIVK